MPEKVPLQQKHSGNYTDFSAKIAARPPHMGNDAVPLQRRVVPIPYHSQRIGETVRLPPK